MGYKLDWKGVQCRAQVVGAVKVGLGRFGLVHETEAKRELGPGHGVLTGTLRRSVHSAAPSYDFSGDDTKASSSSPERGGNAGAEVVSTSVIVAVGSGMRYAKRIEEMYGYIQKGHERARPQLDGLIEQAAREAGLT